MASDSTIIVCPDCQVPNRIPAARLTDRPRCGKCKHPLFTAHPIVLTDRTFDRHLARDEVPLVVDFWAPWCGPCRMMAPFFQQAAAELEPDVRFAKVNTDENRRLARKYRIHGIPTTALFKGGHEVARHPGAMNLSQLRQWIQSHV
jgi:thioredoxin 2